MVFVRFEILTVALLCDVLLVEHIMTFQKIVRLRLQGKEAHSS